MLAGHEQPERRDGVTSPGHSGSMGGFPLARHSLECLRKPGELLLGLKAEGPAEEPGSLATAGEWASPERGFDS